MRKHGCSGSRCDALVTQATISPLGVARNHFVWGHQVGDQEDSKPPPPFSLEPLPVLSQGRRQG